ncbi:transcriptional regulator [Actinomycetospora straminea]|uniref:transcriptional regulator n=1 Tax=Actinomycetospora straminea TaxID=663607 RepID=UPI0023661824|nr:helix-turn-helix transcriptional regulator [Actinomycetospora straminea]MDD7931665.1 helix-turn-helix transcriptional regulator [Actinomycetospora straminea]
MGRSEPAGGRPAGTGDDPGDRAAALRRNRELQRRFYGEPLGDRLRRLLGALDVSQAALAAALGVSSPQLSQLMSGRRVKIGTPAVLGRLVLLEQAVARLGGGRPTTPDRATVTQLLDEVRAAEPRATAGSYDLLRTVAGPDELARAADTLDGGFPSLAGLLRRAATGDPAAGTTDERPDPGR